MSRISTSLIPPGGWTFEQDGIHFHEQTYNDLVGTIIQHRNSNNKPHGNPYQEVQDYICAKHPDTCLDVKMKPAPPTTTIENIRSFSTTIKNFILHGGALEDQNTANIRAQVCVSCHNNVPSGEARRAPGGCGACGKMVQAGIDAVRNIALAGRKTADNDKLQACLLCGCDLKLKVWVPVKYFDPKCEQVNKWPSFCWMKNC